MREALTADKHSIFPHMTRPSAIATNTVLLFSIVTAVLCLSCAMISISQYLCAMVTPLASIIGSGFGRDDCCMTEKKQTASCL